MEFTLVHENKLKVLLAREDMERFSIFYEQMDYSVEPTRKAILAILEEGRARTRFNPQRAKIFIEAYPCEGGGCVLYFTSIPGAAGGKTATPPVVFEFDCAEDMLHGAVGVAQRYGQRIYSSSLYLVAGKYRLVVYPLDYTDRLSVYFLSEYGRRVGEGDIAAARTDESGRLLLAKNAVEVLAEYFARDNGAAY